MKKTSSSGRGRNPRPRRPRTARAADTVTIQLKWVAQAQFAGYFVAKEKGFYKEPAST